MEFVHRPYIPEETIAAIATPPGEGGISIIRVSGKGAFSLVDPLFTGSILSYASHTAHLGKILDAKGDVLDEVLVLIMKGPKSFTGEDTVEIHCHGGSLITKKVLNRVLEAGARMASPGEFSLRAFMNGKIDLAKAEAIEQLISAKNDMACHFAKKQLEGALSIKISTIQKDLLDIAAILEASVDFPEESLEFASKEEVLLSLSTILHSLLELSRTFHEGKKIHEGLSLCLVGPPNAGKSSLMNTFLGKERAIVTEIAGTTRDLLEDSLLLEGLHFRIIDTAGIRHTEEKIEKEGIRRSKLAMQEADIVLVVIDSSSPLCDEATSLLETMCPKKSILVWNKSDLPTHPSFLSTTASQVFVSTVTKTGMSELKNAILSRIWIEGPPSKEEVVLTNVRHKQALDTAISLLQEVILGLQADVSPEFLSFDMRKCLVELGTILGMNISEEILHSIFSKFCIGK